MTITLPDLAPDLRLGDAPAGMDQLRVNYQRVLDARAVYYPVAFHFLRELGRGRQGVVFLGLRQGARGCVTEHAIKVFNPDLYRTPEEYWTDMGRIATQVSRMQRLQSPNLVTRHSYEETYGIGYLQMEAIDGMDVERLLSPAHFPLARRRARPAQWRRFQEAVFRAQGDCVALQPGVAVHILRSVLRGLERLHTMDFLHFDVKPANIMIDRLGIPKIVDFGRAVRVGERLSFLFGSPLYMAPETHRREPCSVRSDLYSVGLVALDMLRGRRLLDDAGAAEDLILQAKLSLPERLASLLPADVRKNSELVEILRKLLAPEPEHRFASAKDAESAQYGLGVVDRQLVHAGLDAEYARDLGSYLDLLVDERTGRVEVT